MGFGQASGRMDIHAFEIHMGILQMLIFCGIALNRAEWNTFRFVADMPSISTERPLVNMAH